MKQWYYLYLLYHTECCVCNCIKSRMINMEIMFLYKPVTYLDWFVNGQDQIKHISLSQVLMVPITKVMVEYWVFNIPKHLLCVMLKCTGTKRNTGTIAIGHRWTNLAMARYIVSYRISRYWFISWHIFIAIITPQTKSIFRTTRRSVLGLFLL